MDGRRILNILKFTAASTAKRLPGMFRPSVHAKLRRDERSPTGYWLIGRKFLRNRSRLHVPCSNALSKMGGVRC